MIAPSKLDFLELKVPPPLVALAAAAMMWGATRAVPSLRAPFRWRAGAGVACAVVGEGIGAAGVVSFRRAKTTMYITRFQIVPEERILAARFGAEYAAYAARVPRWL